MAKKRMNQAIVAAFEDEMRSDPTVVLFGEDVGVAGGPFKTSDGLLEQFGFLRVRDTPISEMGFLGAAVGAAATGLRPVVEIMFIEFLGVALDQLATEAAKFHYLSNGRYRVPMTVRASVGAGLGFGAQHSQTLESWLVGIPGLKVVTASGPQTAYGLLRAAIRDDNPVVVLEPRVLYGVRGEFKRGDDFILEVGKARVDTVGEDVTIVTLGATLGTTKEAASRAAWSAEIIDLMTLVPWDRRTIAESVRRTGRLVIVEESPYSGGWGTEISSYVGSAFFGTLKAPVLRITCPDVPVPYGKDLEQQFVPNPAYVVEQIDQFLASGKLVPPWWEKETV